MSDQTSQVTFRWVERPGPMPNESLMSFLKRWAMANNFDSRSSLLRSLDLSPAVRLAPTALTQLSNALSVALPALQEIAPSVTPRKAVLRLSFIRPKYEAVCPHCLVTGSYSRQLWSHTLATACAEHKSRLIDCCQQCGQRVRIDRPLAHLCDCGADLSRLSTVPATAAEIDFASLLLGNKPEGTSIPLFLDADVPVDVDLFILSLANHLTLTDNDLPVEKAGKLPLPRSLAETLERLLPLFELFEDWPRRFDLRLKQMIEASPAALSTGVAGRYGSWYDLLFRNYRHDAYSHLRVAAANRIVMSHDGTVKRRSQSVLNIATVQKQWFSIKEAAAELRIGTERIQKGIDDCLISASVYDEAMGGRQRFVSRAMIEQLKRIQYEHVSDSYARNLLGVPKAVFDLMDQAGWILRSAPGDVPPVVTGFVKHVPLLGLIERLRSSALANKDRRDVSSIPLRELNYRRTTNLQRLLDLFRAIAAGELLPIGFEEGLSIGGLRFAVDEVDQRIASWYVDRGLTAQQVAALTGAHYDAVKGWIEEGLLPATREPLDQGAPWVVDLRELITFLQTYAALAWQAKSCKSSSRGLTSRLERAGISPVDAEHSGRGTLVRIGDLFASLGRGQTVTG